MAIISVPDTDVTNVGNPPGDGPLRAGGQPGSIDTRNADLPSTPSMCVEHQRPALRMVRDLECGPEKIRAQGQEYLPRSPGEAPANYNDRLQRSVFYNAFGQTVRGMVGMIFRRDPVLSEDVPEVMAEHWENIDNAGTHGAVFLRQVSADVTVAGHGAILVDFPKTGGVQSAAEDTGPGAPIRPYWVPVKKDQIVSFRTAVEDGRTILVQLVLEERGLVPDGWFGEMEQVRYRVLFRGQAPMMDGTQYSGVGYKLLEITKSKSVVVVEDGTYPTQDEIPVAEVKTSGSCGMFDSCPPLIDLAYLNVSHYQQDSDFKEILHKQVPVFVAVGRSIERDNSGNPVDSTLVLGPGAGLDLPMGADAKYISADGSNLEQHRLAIADIKSDMATLGLQQLAPETRAAETAQAKRIDKSSGDSALAVNARALQDACERALQFHANYLKLPSGGSVTINRDFEALAMDAQKISALSTLVKEDQLTLATLWQMLIEGNVMPEEFDPEEELAAIEAERDIQAQKAADIAQQRMESQQTQNQLVVRNPDGTPRMMLSREPTQKPALQPAA